jgi:hypothetical protein
MKDHRTAAFEKVYEGALRSLAFGTALMLLVAGIGTARASDGGSAAPIDPECADRVDNDEDGFFDFPEDPECTSFEDVSEAPDGESAALGSGGGSSEVQTYYQSIVGTESAASLASAAPELPTALFIEDATAKATYERVTKGEWELRIDGFHRNHERVDAIYDMVLVLALPVAPDGSDGFVTLGRGVRVEEGAAARPVSLVYGGEKVVLKRNVGLEKGLLARLVGDGKGQLPPLDGTDYRWTAWDTILSRDASFGDFVQARAILRYETTPVVAPPDARDSRVAAYVITWIPSLPAKVPPYAVRIGVQGAAD